jgi:hypothetical protein
MPTESPNPHPEWPKYRCHKEVLAVKITAMASYVDGMSRLMPEDVSIMPVLVDAKWMAKHEPQAPGYLVRYNDGYISWSPKEAFEEGYTRI